MVKIEYIILSILLTIELSFLYFKFDGVYYSSYLWLSLVVFISTYFRPVFFCKLMLFCLPFLVGIHKYAPAIFDLNIDNIDMYIIFLSSAFYLGTYFHEKNEKNNTEKNWTFELILFIFLFSYLLSGYRSIQLNLFTSASFTSFKGVLFNLANSSILIPLHDFYFFREMSILFSSILIGSSCVKIVNKGSDFKSIIAEPIFLSGTIFALFGLTSRYIEVGFYQLGFANGGINSLFPDIHSFAGFGIINLIIGLKLISDSNPKINYRILYLGASTLLIAMSIFLSKSKFSILIVTIIIVGYIYSILSKKIYLKRLFLGSILFGISGLLYLDHSFNFLGSDVSILKNLSNLNNYLSYNQFNSILSHRPEIFLAALNLFLYFPIFGIGSGNFFRFGKELELGNSVHLNSFNGENAHNYFLQVLAERGTIGLIIFLFLCLIIFYNRKSDGKLSYPFILFLGVISGNLFGHNLLIFYFQILFWIVLFGSIDFRSIDKNRISKVPLYSILSIGLVAVFYLEESIFRKDKFEYGRYCYKEQIFDDHATSGKVIFNSLAPKNGKNIEPIQKASIENSVKLYKAKPNGFEEKNNSNIFTFFAKNSIRIENLRSEEIYISNCYVPINFGENMDLRRLGFRITQ